MTEKSFFLSIQRMGLFGIGTYQSMSGGQATNNTPVPDPVGTYPTTPQPPFQVVTPPGAMASLFTTSVDYYSSVNSRLLPTGAAPPIVNPLAGVYGGTYGYVLDTRIRAPQAVNWTPAPEIGLDATGVSIIRGYPQVAWTYSTLRPDYWYYLYSLYLQAGRVSPAFGYLVLLQYPDPLNNGSSTQTLARWDPPAEQSRDVGAYHAITLTFPYLGQAKLAQNVPILTLS